LYKEEGFTRVQSLVELAQTVLANTAPAGHKDINDVLGQLQEEWSALATKMVETKVSKTRALELRREARMVSPAMGAAMMGTVYFLRANRAQHGGGASGGGFISVSLLSYMTK